MVAKHGAVPDDRGDGAAGGAGGSGGDHRRGEGRSRAAPAPLRTVRGKAKVEGLDQGELEKLVITLEEEMFAAAEELRFEYAAKLRDELKSLRHELLAIGTG